MNLLFNFSDKTVFVVGGGSGLGASIAKSFAFAGANVIIVDSNGDNAKKVADEINSGSPGEAFAIECNITLTPDIQNAINLTLDVYGSLDIAINCAGKRIAPEFTASISEKDFEELIQLNLISVFKCMKYELKQMQEQLDGGVIINIASAKGIPTIPMNSAYISAKDGVLALTKNAAAEYANQNIRINAICPGIIDPPLILSSPQENAESPMALHPMARFGEPEEIASAVLFLATKEAAYINGSAYSVDGGWAQE